MSTKTIVDIVNVGQFFYHYILTDIHAEKGSQQKDVVAGISTVDEYLQTGSKPLN